MDTIKLHKVPQDIHRQHQVDNTKKVGHLFERFQLFQKKQPIEESSIPSAKAVRQWELRAQENLTRYEKNGVLPEGLFDFT